MKIFENPTFGVVLTLGLYLISTRIHRRIRTIAWLSFLNPLILTTILGIAFLVVTRIPLDAYNIGGRYLNFFLGPIVVSLALPLYRNRNLIRRHALPILSSIGVASLVSIVSVILLSRALAIDDVILRSMLGKSTTTPIAIELSAITSGNASLAVMGVILTGNIGAMLSQSLFRLLRIEDPISQGIALGTAAHAVGTATAFSLGKTEGAMSGLAIGISGIASVLWMPIIMALFKL